MSWWRIFFELGASGLEHPFDLGLARRDRPVQGRDVRGVHPLRGIEDELALDRPAPAQQVVGQRMPKARDLEDVLLFDVLRGLDAIRLESRPASRADAGDPRLVEPVAVQKPFQLRGPAPRFQRRELLLPERGQAAVLLLQPFELAALQAERSVVRLLGPDLLKLAEGGLRVLQPLFRFLPGRIGGVQNGERQDDRDQEGRHRRAVIDR